MAIATDQEAGVRPTLPGMRAMLFIASFLVFSIGIPLTLLTERTDRYFAWTVNPPLTAAFLGGAYWASCALEFLAGRERVWARARVAVPAVLVFTALTLVVTLVHLDRFHLDAPHALITRAGTWMWLAVYAVVPLVLAVLLARQVRTPGEDPPRRLPLAPTLRAVILAETAAMALLGSWLLVAPLEAAELWPWRLTALTGRAVGAWLVGLAIAGAQLALENDWWRVPAATAGTALFGALELLALARYARTLDWSGAGTWVYLLWLVSMLAVGIYGQLALARATRGRVPEPVTPRPVGGI